MAPYGQRSQQYGRRTSWKYDAAPKKRQQFVICGALCGGWQYTHKLSHTNISCKCGSPFQDEFIPEHLRCYHDKYQSEHKLTKKTFAEALLGKEAGNINNTDTHTNNSMHEEIPPTSDQLHALEQKLAAKQQAVDTLIESSIDVPEQLRKEISDIKDKIEAAKTKDKQKTDAADGDKEFKELKDALDEAASELRIADERLDKKLNEREMLQKKLAALEQAIEVDQEQKKIRHDQLTKATADLNNYCKRGNKNDHEDNDNAMEQDDDKQDDTQAYIDSLHSELATMRQAMATFEERWNQMQLQQAQVQAPEEGTAQVQQGEGGSSASSDMPLPQNLKEELSKKAEENAKHAKKHSERTNAPKAMVKSTIGKQAHVKAGGKKAASDAD